MYKNFKQLQKRRKNICQGVMVMCNLRSGRTEKVLASQSYPTLCDPMNYSPPGSSALGIFQESILEWVAIPFSRGSSQTMDRTQVSCIAGRFFTIWDNREGVSYSSRFYWAFSWIRHCPFEWLYFIPTISKKWILLFPFYRWENWGSAIRCRT